VPGNLQSLNQLAADARANYIIHTGDFGFYDDRSLDRIAEKYVQSHPGYQTCEYILTGAGLSSTSPSIRPS
jgi:hypothetical protein